MTENGLQGFLGLVGTIHELYYRQFVSQFIALAAPLMELLHKNAFVWTPMVMLIFQHLKDALTQTPIIQLPNFELPFIVQTHTSRIGMCVVLSRNMVQSSTIANNNPQEYRRS